MTPAPHPMQVIHQTQGGAAIQNQRRYENIQNFIRVVQGMDVPSDSTFSYEDLTSDGEMERPRVADCVLWLKRLWETMYLGGGAANGAAPMAIDDTAPAPDNTKKAQLTSRSLSSKFSSSAVAAGPPSAGLANQGVAQLLTHWSSVLRHNMDAAPGGGHAAAATAAFNPSSAEFSVDSMGPIFHSVLNNLTTEYERRLSTKDQDVTRARDAFALLQAQMTEVQRQLELVRTQLHSQQANQQANAEHQASVAALQAEIEALRTELAESQKRCAELQWRLDNASEVSSQQVLDMQRDFAEMSGRLSEFQGLEQRFKATRDENRKLFNQVSTFAFSSLCHQMSTCLV